MITIKVDKEVFEMLGKIAKPFVETSPNMVIRRILGLEPVEPDDAIEIVNETKGESARSSLDIPAQRREREMSTIENLRSQSQFVHPAFLTYLMDKYNDTNGNYKISDIMGFMESFHLRLPSGAYRNPWMKKPYGGEKNGLVSCQRTIEHFRQARKYGCWNGKNVKEGCDASEYCIYHPDNPDQLKNKCDLRKGAIWRRANPDSPFEYGAHYINVIKDQLLAKRKLPLKPLLNVFYPDKDVGDDVVDKFKFEFNMTPDEFSYFFDVDR